MLIHVDPTDPRLEPYRDLPTGELARRAKYLVAEGRLLVDRLLESSFEVESVLVAPRWAEEYAARWPDVTVFVLPNQAMRELVGYQFHLGVMAVGLRKPRLAIDTLMQEAPARLTLLVCPETHSRENLGSLLRSCGAFGAHAAILGPGCVDPFSRRVLRVSMGAALRVPVVHSGDLRADLARLRDAWGVELAATVLDSSAELLDLATRTDRLALVFGSEYEGLAPEWIELCSRKLTIPMHDGTDSLNIGVAAGVFLYHFTRDDRLSGGR